MTHVSQLFALKTLWHKRRWVVAICVLLSDHLSFPSPHLSVPLILLSERTIIEQGEFIKAISLSLPLYIKAISLSSYSSMRSLSSRSYRQFRSPGEFIKGSLSIPSIIRRVHLSSPLFFDLKDAVRFSIKVSFDLSLILFIKASSIFDPKMQFDLRSRRVHKLFDEFEFWG